MGQDKALLPLGGRTLCEQIAEVVSSVAEKVYLVGHPERYRHLKYECIADVRPGFGPLSGLETALSLGQAEFHVVTSCDLFNVKPEWLRALLWEAERGARCAAVQDGNGDLQPLCAVYRSACRPVVSRALSEGRLRMRDLLKELEASPVKVDGAVLNLNTPEEYHEILNDDSRR
jgi:molybdopterin-guanine dinucleotide biosynthesis protein A